MILIYPDPTSDKKPNYKLAEYIKKYIVEKGGEVELGRKSVDAPDVNPLVLKDTVNPDTFIGIYTGPPDGGGKYAVVCDAYSALLGAFNYELAKKYYTESELKSLAIQLITVSEQLNFSSGTDITLHLPGEISSYTDTDLESLAKRLVSGAYWYPVYTLTKDTLTPNIPDPYLYYFADQDFWHETATSELGSTGKIGTDDQDSENHPIHYLEITSKETDPNTYTWTIPLSSVPDTAKRIIFNAKGSSGNEKIFIKAVAGTSSQTWVSDKAQTEYTEYSEHAITLTPSELTSLELGVQGSGTVRFTGIFITDSPSNYNKLPYPYRKEYTEEEIEVQETVPEKPIPALTKADNLDDRATDKIANPEPEPEQETADSPTGGASPATPEGFANALSGIMDQATSAVEGVGGVVDLASMAKIDTSAMTGQISKAKDFVKKLDIAKAKDKLDGMVAGATQQATALLETAKDQAKGLNASLTPAKLTGSLDALKAKVPKVPTAEVTAGIASAKAKLSEATGAINKYKDKLTSGLKDAIKTTGVTDQLTAMNNLKSQTANIKNAVSTAKNAVAGAASKVQSQAQASINAVKVG